MKSSSAAEKEHFPLTAKHLLTPINSYSSSLTARENASGFLCSTAIWQKFSCEKMFRTSLSKTLFLDLGWGFSVFGSSQCTGLLSTCWAMIVIIQVFPGIYHLHIPGLKSFQSTIQHASCLNAKNARLKERGCLFQTAVQIMMLSVYMITVYNGFCLKIICPTFILS